MVFGKDAAMLAWIDQQEPAIDWRKTAAALKA